ncbi:MAG: TIM barrel protein [Acidobacteriota bacterium]|nr:TIM barrel protein [Acidobacteriota bacterium]
MAPVRDALLFGTAGVPHTAADTSTLSALDRIKALGLDCLEIEFVKGVKMGGDTAARIKEKAEALGLALSAHAPYYINLNSEDAGKRLSSQERILTTVRTAALCGARSVVFHAGFYGRETPDRAFAEIRRELEAVLSIVRTERLPVTLRIETMGKKSQFGSLEEVLFLCRELEGLEPCLDFCHIYAREGKVNSYPEFHRVLRKVEKKLGRAALRNVHIHIAGVEFNASGEIRHLDLVDSGFRYDEWIQALRDFGTAGMVICESPNLETDALMLKKLHAAQEIKGSVGPDRKPGTAAFGRGR